MAFAQIHREVYQLFLIPKGMTGSSSTILHYSMNLCKGPKDPYLHSLMYREFSPNANFISAIFRTNLANANFG